MRYLIWIVIVISILIILAAAGSYWFGKSSSNIKSDTQVDTSTSTKPLGYIAKVARLTLELDQTAHGYKIVQYYFIDNTDHRATKYDGLTSL